MTSDTDGSREADPLIGEGGAPVEKRSKGLGRLAGWTMIARSVAQLTQFFGFVIAARYLGPADFGLFSLVFIFTTLLTLMASSGWRELLLTHDREGDAAQFLALVLGCVAGLLLSFGGSLFATLSGIQIGALCWLLGLSVAPTCVTTVQNGRLLAEGRAARLALVQILSELAALAALTLSLLSGAGLLALGISKLAFALTGLLTALTATRWLGFRVPSQSELRIMVRFTGSILMSRLIFFFQENASLMLIGAFLGPAGAGLYRAGSRIAASLAEVLHQTLQIVGWSAFRQATQDAAGSEHATQMTKPAILLMTVLLAGSIPAFLGLAILATPLITTLLGPEWAPSAAVLTALAIRRMLIQPQGILEPILSLSGAVNIIPRLSAINATVSLTLLILLAPRGLLPAASGQTLAGFLSVPVTLWALQTYAGVTISTLLRHIWPILVAAALMLVAMISAMHGLDARLSGPLWLHLVTYCLVGMTTYLCALVALMPEARRVLRAGRRRVGL